MLKLSRNKQLYQDIIFCADDLYFELPLCSSRIAVQAEHEGIKDYLLYLMKAAQVNGQAIPVLQQMQKSIILLNEINTLHSVRRILECQRDKLIIIDDADELLRMSYRKELLDFSQNQLILFTENNERYDIPVHHVAKLTDDGQRIYFEYRREP